VIDTIRGGTFAWRRLFAAQLGMIEAKYSPKLKTSIDDLTDMLSVCLEGGVIL
jgi:hypothetical protein